MNKLGILNKETLLIVEKSLVETKISLLDYEFTFGECEFNIQFLINLHEYLFGDIYVLQNNDLRGGVSLSKEDQDQVNTLLYRLNIKGVYGVFDEESLDIFHRLWDMQIFSDGNTRTLIAFLKIYASAFQFEKYINFNEFYSLWSEIFDFRRIRIKK